MTPTPAEREQVSRVLDLVHVVSSLCDGYTRGDVAHALALLAAIVCEPPGPMWEWFKQCAESTPREIVVAELQRGRRAPH